VADGAAYLLHHFWPGGTEEQYRTMLAAVHLPNGLPEGQTFPPQSVRSRGPFRWRSAARSEPCARGLEG
jgi:hypothetical protein